MQIGRKIYYELATGNVILTIGEREGDVVTTTETQDFAMYSALAPYQQSAVGVMQLTFGQDATNFAQYPYHIDITQNPPVIAWDTNATTVVAMAQAQKIAQLENMMVQTLNAGFTSSANGTATTYGYSSNDQSNMNKIATAMQLNIETWPINYADINGNVFRSRRLNLQRLLRMRTVLTGRKSINCEVLLDKLKQLRQSRL